MGWKVVTIIGAHSWGVGPGNLNRLAEASLKWHSGQVNVRRHNSLSFAHVFKPCQFKDSTEFNAFKQKTRKSTNDYLHAVRPARRDLCLTDSKTEPSSPSHPPAPERTSTNRSSNKQTEKVVKEPNSALARALICGTHRAHTERHVSNRLNNEFASYCSCTDIYKMMSKYPSWRVSLKKTVGYVLSKSNQLR